MYMHQFNRYDITANSAHDLHNYGMSCTLRFEPFINYDVLCIH